MKKIDFAQKAFILNERKVLLVKKFVDDPSHPNEWEIPGGRIEFGEKLDDHIKREVREEVGIDIEPLTLIAMWTWTMHRGEDDIQVVAVGRLCRALNYDTSIENRVRDDYLADIEWVDIGKVLDYNLIPDIIPAMTEFVKIYG